MGIKQEIPIRFPTRKDTEWESLNPTLGYKDLIFVGQTEDGVIQNYRAKLGYGEKYVDTKFLDEFSIENVDSRVAELVEEELASLDLLLKSEVVSYIEGEGYKLLTTSEWSNIQEFSLETPVITIDSGFDFSTDREVGQVVNGNIVFSFIKTNIENIRDGNGGEIIVSSGSFSGTGSFDVKNVGSKTITANNVTLTSFGSIDIIINIYDIYDKIIHTEVFTLTWKEKIFVGWSANVLIGSQDSLLNRVDVLTGDSIEESGELSSTGSLRYFNVAIPTGRDLKIKLNSIKEDMTLHTKSFTINGQSINYNVYYHPIPTYGSLYYEIEV